VRSRLASDAGERLQSLALAEQALAADPNNANTWMWKGLTLLEVGHVGARTRRSSGRRRWIR